LDERRIKALSTCVSALELLASEALANVQAAIDIRDGAGVEPADRLRAVFGMLDRAGIVGGLKLEHAPSTTAPADRSTLLEDLERDVGTRAQGEQAQR
jgi:hypothetical protein